MLEFSLLQELQAPQIVFIRLLEACNAKCQMCRFAGSIDSFRLPLEKIKRLTDELAEMGTKQIRFTGGEPTLYGELPEAIAHISQLGLRASIITNGAFLFDCADRILDAGIDGIVCSLDSPRPKLHNALRGTPNLLEDAIAGLAAINKKRREQNLEVGITVNTIVSNQTYDHLDEFIPILEAVGVDYWNLIPLKNKRSMYLSIDQIAKFDSIAKRIRERMKSTHLKLNAVTQQIFGATPEQVEASASGRMMTHRSCFVPYFVAYIDAKNGQMTACNCLPHRPGKPLTVSGVWERPFADIWNDPAYVKMRRQFAGRAPKICSGCEPANVRFNRDMERALLNQLLAQVDWI